MAELKGSALEKAKKDAEARSQARKDAIEAEKKYWNNLFVLLEQGAVYTKNPPLEIILIKCYK